LVASNSPYLFESTKKPELLSLQKIWGDVPVGILEEKGFMNNPDICGL
jgi:hypothetical protein